MTVAPPTMRRARWAPVAWAAAAAVASAALIAGALAARTGPEAPSSPAVPAPAPSGPPDPQVTGVRVERSPDDVRVVVLDGIARREGAIVVRMRPVSSQGLGPPIRAWRVDAEPGRFGLALAMPPVADAGDYVLGVSASGGRESLEPVTLPAPPG